MSRIKISAIYRIICLITGKGYVGSAIDLKNRWAEHRKQLRGKYHHSILLQRAWNKYGEENFVFEIIELVVKPTKKKLETREQYWIDFYEAANPVKGYNIAPKAGTNLGIKYSKETRLKNSLAHKGMIAWNKDSWKEKVSERDLLAYYQDGNSMGDCKAKFHISLDSIRLVLRRNGIMRSPLEGRKQEKFRNKIRDIITGKTSPKKGIKTGISWNRGSWKKKASEKQIIEFYKLGNSLKDCKQKFGISIDTIRMVLLKHNTIRTAHEGMVLEKAQVKRIKAFKKWRNQNKVLVEA